MTLIEKVKKFIDENGLLEKEDKVVLGVSGGADSVALLLILNALKPEYALTLRVVHVHHMIRGEEADRDAAFVRKLAGRLGVPYEGYKRNIPDLAKERHETEEEAGRRERYEIFEKVRKENGYTKIAVAHHADDAAETILFNMIRGSSLRGISGMDAKKENLIRPMLSVTRQEIEEFLNLKKQTYCVDYTNGELDYSRNRIRNVILPEMKKINPEAVQHILLLAKDAVMVVSGIELAAKKAEEQVIYDSYGLQAKIKVSELSSLAPDVFGEVVLSILEHLTKRRKDIGRTHIEAVRMLLQKKSGSSVDLPYSVKVCRVFDDILFVREKEAEEKELEKKESKEKESKEKELKEKESKEKGQTIKKEDLKRKGELTVSFGEYVLQFALKNNQEKKQPISKADYKKSINYDMISNDLFLRVYESKDKICVIREQKDEEYLEKYKKIPRLFMEAKIPIAKRHEIPLLFDGDECILIAGVRLSEKYKVTEETEWILEVTCLPKTSESGI